jgi:hypothetical protein
LSFGPIDPTDSEVRRTWLEKELGSTEWWPSAPEDDGEDDGDNGWERVAANTRAFWKESLSRGHRKIAWVSRRSAIEYAGFLEWLWRLGDAPCEVIDLTEVKISSRAQFGLPRPQVSAVSLSLLSPDKISINKLWDLAEPMQVIARGRYLDLWRQLRSENAPLRVISGENLVSAPITFFDQVLLAHVKTDWLKVARVVGEALGDFTPDRICQVGDRVLAARIDFLIKTGVLESRGRSPFSMRFSEVRLPEPRG